MNRQIEVLYKIFELELAPPFQLINMGHKFIQICNKRSEPIAYYNLKVTRLVVEYPLQRSCLIKIKQIFNVEKLSDNDVYHIAKHLFNWLEDKSLRKVSQLPVKNIDTGQYIIYPEDKVKYE